MTNHQIEINKRILKVFLLADLIELEIKDINPEVNINDTETMLRLVSLRGSCKRFREKYDCNNEDFANKLGEISDMMDECIIDISKDW